MVVKRRILLNGVNILVVEDNIVNQKIVGRMLARKNATVTSAMNGCEAIDILRERNFDAVLMDLQMPGMDGFETTRHIRGELKNNVPVIALTADLFVMETDACRNAGMDACISKPYDAEVLDELILSLMKNKTGIL